MRDIQLQQGFLAMVFNPSQIADNSSQSEVQGLCACSERSLPSHQPRLNSSWPQRIPSLLLLCAVPLILLYTFIVPPFQVPDEDEHLVRAYGVSEGILIARRTTRIPVSFLSLAERFCPFPGHFPPPHVLRVAELAYWLRQPLQNKSASAVSNPAADIYSFVPYLPSAIVFVAGRFLELSPLSQLYAARLVNGAMYVGIMYWAITILPEFQLLFLTIVLTPMALNQAASLSADSLTLGLTALLAAWIFRMAWDANPARLRRPQQALLVLLFVLVTLCKFYPWTALLAFLLPSEKLGSKRKAIAFKLICSFAVCASGIGWFMLNHSAIAAFKTLRASLCCIATQNSAFVANHPFRFLEVIVFTDFHFYLTWISQFVGMLGWLSIRLNPLPVAAYAICIGMAARMRTSAVSISRLQRILLFSFFVLTMLYLHLALWIFSAGTQQLQDALSGAALIPGIQGRYFLPIAFPVLVLISSRPFWLRTRTLLSIVGIIMVVHIYALSKVWQTYS